MTQQINDTETPDTLLTVKEAAQQCRCAISLIYRLIASGDLPAVSLSKKSYRIPKGALSAHLAGKFVNTTNEGTN